MKRKRKHTIKNMEKFKICEQIIMIRIVMLL